MISIFKRKPKGETVSKAEHERLIQAERDEAAVYEAAYFTAQTDLDRATRELKAERASIRNLVAEIQSLKPDAERYREKLRRDREYHANRRQSRDKQQAGEVVA